MFYKANVVSSGESSFLSRDATELVSIVVIQAMARLYIRHKLRVAMYRYSLLGSVK
jgi:hypothetical protein